MCLCTMDSWTCWLILQVKIIHFVLLFLIVYYPPREVKVKTAQNYRQIDARGEAEGIFFTTDGGGYTIFLRSRAQKWQFSLAQREQNCYFAPAAKK